MSVVDMTLADRLAMLDRKIEASKAYTAKLEALRAVMADPTGGDVLEMLGLSEPSSNNSGDEKPAVRKKRKGSAFMRICKFYSNTNNEWATTFEISEKANVVRGLVRAQLYKEHNDKFEVRQHPDPPPGKGSMKQYRLKPASLKSYQAERAKA